MKLNKFLKKVDLIKILKKIGIKNLNILDDNIMGSCPLHEDKNPSWGINKITGQYNCFSCGDKGNLITLISKQMNISFSEAVKVLHNYAGLSMKVEELIIDSKMIYRQIKKMLKLKTKETESKIEAIISLPLDLSDSFMGGLDYFVNRGINEDTLQRYNIKFCMSGFYKNRAIIPILDANGKLVNFEARDITGMAEKKVLYPKGANINNTLYNLHIAKYNSKSVIVVEGLMDALYLAQRGFNVVSTYGVNMSERQEELLSKYFQQVYLAYDGDKAGRKAIIKYGSLLDLHLSVYVIILPKGKDPDGLTKKQFMKLYNTAEDFDIYISKRLLNHIANK